MDHHGPSLMIFDNLWELLSIKVVLRPSKPESKWIKEKPRILEHRTATAAREHGFCSGRRTNRWSQSRQFSSNASGQRAAMAGDGRECWARESRVICPDTWQAQTNKHNWGLPTRAKTEASRNLANTRRMLEKGTVGTELCIKEW